MEPTGADQARTKLVQNSLITESHNWNSLISMDTKIQLNEEPLRKRFDGLNLQTRIANAENGLNDIMEAYGD